MLEDDGESAIRLLLEQGDAQGAVTRGLEIYGPEIFGFLVATMRDDVAAGDAFSAFSEDMWKGIHRFQWRSSLRTWLYVLARNAAAAHRRSPHNRRDRNQPLSQVSEIADRVRTQTATYLKTEAKDAIGRLRETLAPDEQALLILRIDKRMAWKDIAEVMTAGEADVDLAKTAARLRKRFELLKDRLRERAIAEGIVSSGS